MIPQLGDSSPRCFPRHVTIAEQPERDPEIVVDQACYTLAEVLTATATATRAANTKLLYLDQFA